MPRELLVFNTPVILGDGISRLGAILKKLAEKGILDHCRLS